MLSYDLSLYLFYLGIVICIYIWILFESKLLTVNVCDKNDTNCICLIIK